MTALQLGADGWLKSAAGVQCITSPNCDARPADTAIDLVVIHNISLPPGKFGGDHVARLFTNTLAADAAPGYEELVKLRVSAHFYICRSGEIIQFVSTTQRAAHAGTSRWRGCERCNDFSIGIELEGTDLQPFEAEQYISLLELLSALSAAHPLQAVVGHNDIAPTRKTDPGPYFDWEQIYAALPQLAPESWLAAQSPAL